MAKNNNPLTPDIIIESLKRSSLQTVLVEGEGDLKIYRRIEQELLDRGFAIYFLPCNGKLNLLEVYKSRNEIPTKLLFICDSDLWLFCPKPAEFNDDLITTEGYSIENELYQDGKDMLKGLFDKDELIRKKKIIKNLCSWFAYEVSLVLKNNSHDCKFSEVSVLNHKIMGKNSCQLSEDFLGERGFTRPPDELEKAIADEYHIKLRGKFIFQTLQKLFQERDKNSVTLVRYNDDQLFDLIYRNVSKSNDATKILNRRKQQIIEHFQEN